MEFNKRKLSVWLISLGAVIAVFLLYNLISQTPPIVIDTAEQLSGELTGTDAAPADTGIGKVGEVDVGTVQKAKYIRLHKNRQIDREFGFDTLLREAGNEWEVDKPYMNIYRRNLICFITADRGKAFVEDAAGRPTPKDVTLTDNVVIHIVPQQEADIKESFIYLDNVTFISDKSQYSTPGPVRFVSDNAQMNGTGLEIIFNDEKNRLELLRIIELQSLRLKVPQEGMFPSKETDVESSADQNKTQKSAKTNVTVKPSQQPAPNGQEKGQHYKCLFRGNVVIDSSEQLIFADEFCVNNITQTETSADKSAEAVPNSAPSVTERTPASKQTSDTIEPGDQKESSQQLVDIIVTCSEGVIVLPMNAPEPAVASSQLTSAANQNRDKTPKDIDDTNRPIFVAKRIDYDAITGDAVATGPSQLTFYTSDITDTTGRKTSVPVNVNAQKKAQFFPALNQVVFQGSCLCKMLREEQTMQKMYTLSAPKITVTLPADETRQSSASAVNIEHLKASGGTVRLATIKTAEETSIGGVELKCSEFNYDTNQQLCSATGPGLIKVDNSKAPKPKKDVSRFSLQRPCYAIVRDFNTLNYYLQTNKIIADAGRQEILIDYFPITKGKYGRQVSATANHIDALLYETAPDQLDLSTLTATGGISYEELGAHFEGSSLFYDTKTSIITADGDESQPCYLNGAPIVALKYDLEAGRITATITGPGALQR
ncbi:MAG: LPS export ABC transporter periplasmic protein LptC [Planctomycetota bacterium]|jgi:lipopolysaccharide export system protein LptA